MVYIGKQITGKSGNNIDSIFSNTSEAKGWDQYLEK